MQPDVYAAVLDPHVADFKVSSLKYLDRADAILLPSTEPDPDAWPRVSPRLIERIPRFPVPPPAYCSGDFCGLIREKMASCGKLSSNWHEK